MMKKILIEIGHPAHVHQFRNLYKELVSIGWEGLFVTKDKEFTIDLLKYYDLPYEVLGKTKQGMLSKVLSLPSFALKMFKVARQFKPDIFISRVSPLSGWSSFLLRKPHIAFTDTENVKLMDTFSEPFADVVLTSTVYLRNHGRKHIRYPGYHELAYLHPDQFKADNAVLQDMGLSDSERYAIVRFVAWTAHHDVGEYGLQNSDKVKLVNMLLKTHKVFISAEGQLPKELEQYSFKMPPERIHDAMGYADIYVGESPTMAEESAMLGVQAILVSSWAGETGIIQDLEKYKLVSCIHPKNIEDMYTLISKFSTNKNIKKEALKKRDFMLSERINVTDFYTWFIDEYPNSVNEMKKKRGNNEA